MIHVGLETAPYFMRRNVIDYINQTDEKVHKNHLCFLDDIHKNPFLPEKQGVSALNLRWICVRL